MITLGYNGFSASRAFFAEVYQRTDRDRFRVLGHDAAAALVIDGELVAAAEEERFVRDRKTSAFPRHAIEFCLREAGIGIDDVDRVAFGWCFDDAIRAEELDRIERDETLAPDARAAALVRMRQLHSEVTGPTAIRQDFEKHTGRFLGERDLELVPHHTAHLLAGLGVHGGGTDVAYLVSDGRGELYSAIGGEVRDGRIHELTDMRVTIHDSLAQLYSKVTRYLGFTPNSDEYKVMGLASYASVTAQDNPLLTEVVRLADHGRYHLAFRSELLDQRGYHPLFDRVFGRPVADADLAHQAYVAACAQNVVEVLTERRVRYLREHTSAPVLLLEGGLALNCVTNAKIAALGLFDDVHVSFCASDPGVSIGAALYAQRGADGVLRPPASAFSPYRGPAYANAEIAARLHDSDLRWRFLPDAALIDEVAGLLATTAVVGWFQGAMEYGPRALGNRSILANASDPSMRDRVNILVKKREEFRPFAPAVLEDLAPEVLEMHGARRSRLMTFTYAVRDGHRDQFRAAIHVDGTARVQTVSADSNPLFHRLLCAVHERTGCPGVLNTSFNIAGEPLVCAPEDALRTFTGTDIDVLVIGNYLVTKPE
jgi:carbamoyltransferase